MPDERPIVRLKSSASEREATMDSNSRLEERLSGREIGEKMRGSPKGRIANVG